uniref:Uncharacterized protein n=1 Tax=Rhizophagus irregularis (strain DAOM 181602 / DAOM 197198 / MUCL 43194) TaxID=747089 RepID=U9U3C9_RHIID
MLLKTSLSPILTYASLSEHASLATINQPTCRLIKITTALFEHTNEEIKIEMIIRFYMKKKLNEIIHGDLVRIITVRVMGQVVDFENNPDKLIMFEIMDEKPASLSQIRKNEL